MTIASLSYLVCPICTEHKEGIVLMDMDLTEKVSSRLEKSQGQIVGFMENPCDKCQKEIVDIGDVFIGYDEDKSLTGAPPYRTGHIVVIKRGVIEDAKPIQFMEIKLMKQLGLVKEES